MVIGRDHPIENNSVIFPSPALKKCNRIIKTWADDYVTGGMIFGTQRVGKTKSIQYFVRYSKKVYGLDAPVIHHCSTSGPSDELPYLQSLLDSAGHELPHPSSLSRARTRIIDFLEYLAISSHDNRIILIVDDAQWLEKDEFHWLMWIHNKLVLEEIYLLVVLVGQPELMARAAEFINHPEILARFMNEAFVVAGIERASQMRTILQAIDLKFEYPPSSGISFTASYAPNAFKSGFRLSEYSEDIFDEFNRISKGVRGKRVQQLTMQTVSQFIRNTLRTISKRDDSGLILSKDLIEASIKRSGFRSLELSSRPSTT